MQSNWMIVPEDNDLMHFKYIDKIKTKSGKWRYVYSKAADKIKNAGNNIKNKLQNSSVARTLRKGQTTNKGNPHGQYSPTIKTINPYETTRSVQPDVEGGKFHAITKALTENGSSYGDILDSHRKTSVTNNFAGDYDPYTGAPVKNTYTPNYTTQQKKAAINKANAEYEKSKQLSEERKRNSSTKKKEEVHEYVSNYMKKKKKK